LLARTVGEHGIGDPSPPEAEGSGELG